jgi:subtilisin family serine protease
MVLLFILLPAILSAGGPLPIHFANGYSLVGSRVVPAPPPGFLSDSAAAQGSYWIVQLAGPVRHDWLEQMAEKGARAISYLPQQGVVICMEPKVREHLPEFDFVSGVSPFQPIFKVAPEVLDFDSLAELLVAPFPDHDVDSLARVIDGSAARVEGVAGRVITVRCDGPGVAQLARLDAVQWIQHRNSVCSFNDNVQWVTQVGWLPQIPSDSSGRRIWQKGIRGQGMVLATEDKGLNTDHEMFADPLIPIRDAGIYLNHRKIVAYKIYGNAAFGDDNGFHGTKVTCTAAGNDAPNGNSSPFDGVAPDAKIYFLDLGDPAGNYRIDNDLTAMVDSIYLGQGVGAHVLQHSTSWGSVNNPRGGYDIWDATMDAANWRYPDLLSICATGNDRFNVKHPAAAKNVLSVGGSGNGIGSDTFWPFSSPGPMRDGRVKPEVVAPSVDVWSAAGPGPAVYAQGSGTSFAAPAVNGACALIRQYLNDGWYPSGQPEPNHRIANPSSALMRALAIVSADPNVRVAGQAVFVPDARIGWGRLDLDSVLYFAGDARRLALWDDQQGLATGETREFHVTVTDTMIPLRVVLSWTDTAASANAEITLMNNLDLEAGSSNGYYRGNKDSAGQSAHNPLGWDSVNTNECIRVNRPARGDWLIRVRAPSVFTARQPFALVVTGAFNAEGIAESRPGLLLTSVTLTPNPARNRLVIS